jgi:hypothetical protein
MGRKHVFVGKRICDFRVRQFKDLRSKATWGFWAVCPTTENAHPWQRAKWSVQVALSRAEEGDNIEI